ncbi:hypothetical protein [Parvibaculum sp. MBR-TMA-1.3b-4.2]|jgi:hypothetical protein
MRAKRIVPALVGMGDKTIFPDWKVMKEPDPAGRDNAPPLPALREVL